MMPTPYFNACDIIRSPLRLSSLSPRSEGCRSLLSGPDPDGVLEVRDEDLPVADLAPPAGAGSPHDGVDDPLGVLIVHRDLHLHLGNQVYRVFVSTVDL